MVKLYATGVTLLALLFAYMTWRLDEKRAQAEAERDAANEAIHDLMADSDALTIANAAHVAQLETKVADYEALTGSWTADMVEGGDQ